MATYITVGATTTHGGKVISGSPHTTHNDIPISRKGDKVVCKKCKKLTTIVRINFFRVSKISFPSDCGWKIK